MTTGYFVEIAGLFYADGTIGLRLYADPDNHSYVSFLINRDETVVHLRNLAGRLFDGGANPFHPGPNAIIFYRLAQGSRVYRNDHKNLSVFSTGKRAASMGSSRACRSCSLWHFLG